MRAYQIKLKSECYYYANVLADNSLDAIGIARSYQNEFSPDIFFCEETSLEVEDVEETKDIDESEYPLLMGKIKKRDTRFLK